MPSVSEFKGLKGSDLLYWPGTKVLVEGVWGTILLGIITHVPDVYFDGFVYPTRCMKASGRCFRLCIENELWKGEWTNMQNTKNSEEGDIFRVEAIQEVRSRDREDCLLSDNDCVRKIGTCGTLWYENA